MTQDEFAALLGRLTDSAEAGDGERFAQCFDPDAVYHDYIYGDHRGRGEIAQMLEGMFHRDAAEYRWRMFDPVCQGDVGYASFEDDTETSAIVLAGAADVFTLGFDLREAKLEATSLAERRQLQALGPRLCRAWETLEPMTFAAIEGWCVGGGVALVAALDLRLASAGARFYVPEIERGMNMSWQSVPRLVALMGPARTKRLTVMAERIDAERACAWGLVDETTPAGAAFDAAMAMAERVAALPPVQVRMCKEGVNAASTALHHAVSFMDRDQYALAAQSEDYREGVRAYLEKRKPRYTGR